MKNIKRNNYYALLIGVFLISITLFIDIKNEVIAKNNLPEGFIYADQVIPNLIFEPRYYSDNNFTGRRVDGYLSDKCVMTYDCAVALCKVQNDLMKNNMSIKIFDAYRPQTAVDFFMRWAADVSDQKNKARYYPDVDKANVFKEGYVASPSSHSRGSAVDLTIVVLSTDGKYTEIDMGTGFDYFGKLAWPDNTEVSAIQYANRMLLSEVMQKNGFAPYDKEWWHFVLANEPFPNTYFDFPVE